MEKLLLLMELNELVEDLRMALIEEIELVADGDEEDDEVLDGDCSFPIVYSIGDEPCDGDGGEPIDNPLIVRVHSAYEAEAPNVKYTINLQDAVDNLVDMLDEDLLGVAEEVRDALQGLVDQLSLAIDFVE